MKAIWKWLPSLGGSLLMAASTFASSPTSPAAARDGAASFAPSDEQQLRPLLEQLTQMSQLIERNSQSPQVWQYHLEQAELLLRLAVQSQDKERDGVLRMAVDGFYSAALLSPRDQPIAFERLRQLPQRLSHYFPGNPAVLYAVLQEIQADCVLVLEQTGGDSAKSEKHRCERLLQFARQHPEVPEAAQAVLQAAQTTEKLGEADEAGRCYRYLIEHFPNDAAARKAAGALWRLGQNHQPMALELPLLYTSGSSRNTHFNLDELRGRLVVVYFWNSSCTHAEEDFQILKQLTDRYAGRGLEVVYVNMDAEPAQGRAFLSGRLTAGVHLHQAGGLDGPVAERYGLQEVPQAFLVGRDGTLLKHSLPVSRLESELADRLPHAK
jgi:cytochrome c biogenesis protein CcmG/thiol:disulfide interchange protein DsbE